MINCPLIFRIYCFVLFIAIIQPLSAQDTLVRTNLSREIVKILEIDQKNVTYKKFNNPSGPVYILDKRKISRILFSNGTIDTLTIKKSPPQHFARIKSTYINDTSRNLVSFVISDPFFGQISFGYELLFRQGKFGIKIPFSVGFPTVGIGDKTPDDFASFSYYVDEWYRRYYFNRYKIYSTGIDINYYTAGGKGKLRYFIGPALEFGEFNYLNNSYVTGNTNKRGSYGSLLIKNGLIYHLKNRLCISINIAGGIFMQLDKKDDSFRLFTYPDEIISFEAGLNLGYKF